LSHMDRTSRLDIDSRRDSGEVELGLNECKVTTKIAVFNIRDRNCHTLKIKFTLCNKIIDARAAPEEEEMRVSTKTQADFQQFGFQTLNDFEFLLNDATTADVAIKVTLGVEKIFQSHKVILAGQLRSVLTFIGLTFLFTITKLSDELFHFSSESSFSRDVRKSDEGSRRERRCN